jgi:hypothetical protein
MAGDPADRLAEIGRLLEAAADLAADLPTALTPLAQLRELLAEVDFLAAIAAAEAGA